MREHLLHLGYQIKILSSSTGVKVMNETDRDTSLTDK